MIRVAHLPGRTPYARKLHDDDIKIINETRLPSGEPVPRDVSFGWLLSQADLDSFDVLHVHSLELAAEEVIDVVLDRCAAVGKRVVMTVHDISAMFENQEQYERKLRRVAERGIPMVTLTHGAADRLMRLVGLEHRPVVLPHGYVVPPDYHASGGLRHRLGTGRHGVVYAMYGGFRPNRLMHPVCVNAAFGLPSADRLRILTRALSPVELQSASDADKVTQIAAQAHRRIELVLRPFPGDEEITAFLSTAHVLVMPYLWGSHSGQLEAAFDLGLVPVASDTGYLREQRRQHGDLVAEPIWFNWSDDARYSYGARLLEALLQAREAAMSGPSVMSVERFQQHRRAEHARILVGYRELYDGSLDNT